ncbi:hypothetical protein MM188_003198 [Vibrio cholerae]|nr:hypothetical protein [Vibrio cholerae]
MSIQKRYIQQSTLWWNDKERLIDEIVAKLEKEKFVKTWDEKSQVSEIIKNELADHAIYRSYRQEERENRFGWRIAYVLLIVFQWLLWPYCAYRWFRTGNFRVDAQSKLGNFINRIVTEAE